MDELVTFLTQGEHPVEAGLDPDRRTVDALKESVERGYVYVKFLDTHGGTELGVRADPQRSILDALQPGHDGGTITIVGDLTLNFVPVTLTAHINLATLDGTGQLATRPLDQEAL
jgi:hypothetical protein